MGNALVDIMTLLETDETLDILKLPKGSMQLVDFETSGNILSYTKNLKQSLACGGSAANTARSLAELKIETAYLGKIGVDDKGKFFLNDTIRAGVNPLLKESSTPTGTAIALVSKDSERTFATYLGAAAELTPDDIDESLFDGYGILHIEGYLIFNQILIEKAVRMAKKCGLTVSIDLASYNVVEINLDFIKYLVSEYVDIVFANEEEAKAFTGKEPEDALDEIAGNCKIAVVKIGEKGSLVKSGQFCHKEGVIVVNAVDTTGAGDNYAAGFLYGLAKGFSLDKCAKIGALLSGHVIEVIGTKMGDEKWKLIRDRIENR